MDAAFLARIADAPDDRLARLVYADWLDEQPDADVANKSAFLRLAAELMADRPGEDDPRRATLRALAAQVGADWLAVVGDPRVENCAAKRAEPHGLNTAAPFEFVCDKRWDELRPTDAAGVRFCDACKESVHHCETVAEARRHARAGRCVAVDLRPDRTPGDLVPRALTVGGAGRIL